MLPPGNGNLRLRGCLPNLGPKLKGQTIRVECGGAKHEAPLDFGEFDLAFAVASSKRPAEIMVRASKYIVPADEGLGPDNRRLAYMLKAPEWAN